MRGVIEHWLIENSIEELKDHYNISRIRSLTSYLLYSYALYLKVIRKQSTYNINENNLHI